MTSDGHTQSFSSQKGMFSGFSDTLWYGEDHFNFCRHLEGKRALVFYQSGADNSSAGTLLGFEIRDDVAILPPIPASEAVPASASAAQNP